MVFTDKAPGVLVHVTLTLFTNVVRNIEYVVVMEFGMEICLNVKKVLLSFPKVI